MSKRESQKKKKKRYREFFFNRRGQALVRHVRQQSTKAKRKLSTTLSPTYVEDDALAGHSLGQILDRLGLARTGRTFRRTAQVQL